VRSVADDQPIRPEVAVLDWLDPPMVAGHWVPELVELAGGNHEPSDPGDASTPRAWADVREHDPDILIVAPCGFDIEQIADNRTDLTDRAGWSGLRAVRMNRVYAVDGDHLMNRPGPRVVDSLETLAALIQPDVFDVPEPWMMRPFSALPE
jgi:iron complex transport system substrate-binding protein